MAGLATPAQYLKFANYYVNTWGVNVVFMSPYGKPLYSWKDFESRRMATNDLVSLWQQYVQQSGSSQLILAMVTGSYQMQSERPAIVADLDRAPQEKEKREAMVRQLLKEGYAVVLSPRGLHVHAFLERGERPPYLLVLYRGDERAGEGGALGSHLWNMPPSRRSLGENGWYTYAFAMPDGFRLARYDEALLSKVLPTTVTFSDFVNDMEVILGVKVTAFNPAEEVAAQGNVGAAAGEPIEAGKRAVFSDAREFALSFADFGVPLPRCVAWVMYHYYLSVGDTYSASKVAARLTYPEELTQKIPHGMRRLAAYTFTLFAAHVIERVKYSEILEMLAPAIEDWPEDKGEPLDRALKYVLLFDPEGYVYPRYAGMGAMNPKSVFGEAFCGEERCPFHKACGGRYPWRPFIREVRKRIVSNMLQPDTEL